jgi:hypothetical protein
MDARMSGVHAGHPDKYRVCQEPACREHRNRYGKRWRLDQERGVQRMTDGTATRNHIATLRGMGWSLRAISGASGVSASCLSQLLKGGRVQVRTEARVLAVSPEQVPHVPSKGQAEVFVSRVGTTRRIQALLRLGWRHQDMREVCGKNTALLLGQSGLWVTRSTHDDVAAMYRVLSSGRGPSKATATRAERMGFASPLEWDDIDLDPTPEVVVLDEVDVDLDEVVVLRVLAGERLPTTTQERFEIMRRWLADGHSEKSLLDRMGWRDGRYKPQEVA